MEYDALFTALQQWGAEPLEGVARCVDDAELYVSCLQAFAWDPCFDILRETSSPRQTLETAHTLKGVAGNLSLTPLFELLSLMVAQLRAGVAEQVSEQICRVNQLQLQLQGLLSCVETW